jgi:hypothetical protein
MQICYKLKPFHGARVCFHGFPDDERQHMTEVLQENGGTATELEDPACTHVVRRGCYGVQSSVVLSLLICMMYCVLSCWRS